MSTTVDETASSTNAVSNNLITETALVDYVGTPSVTTNGTGIVRPMHKLYARSITETTNAAFSWIKAGVHDVTSGYDTTKDNRLATMACTHNHISAQINQSKVSPTFTGTVTLPSSVLLGSIPLVTWAEDLIDTHTFTSIDMSSTVLTNASLQIPATDGLTVLNANQNGYMPVFCRELYVEWNPGSETSLTSLLGEKINKPYSSFVWPSGLTDTELNHITNVTSDVQGQIDSLTNGKHPLTPVDTAPTSGSTNLIESGAVYNSVSALTTSQSSILLAITQRHPLTSFDTTPTNGSSNFLTSGSIYTALLNPSFHPIKDSTPVNGSTNAIESNAVHDLFNDQTTARTSQSNFAMRYHEYLGKAQIEVWHGYSGVFAQSFADVISHIGVNSSNFYTFGGTPGSGTYSYYTTSCPAIINTGTTDANDFKVGSLTVANNFLVRWTFVFYAYESGTHTFRLGSDDGSRLQIRDSTSTSTAPTTVVLMDTDQAYTTSSATINLTPMNLARTLSASVQTTEAGYKFATRQARL